ncbi:hypothetical protein ERO13_A04G133900v2 [Gossypium hirsutum]|uniref:Uncharacterized protein n=6 Tax=Gossypium TaxID=3633 RepID=A0A2P5YF79_GOSBA|nr:uncharacterized protein LOC107933393 [Gossypium hirsutum]KAB2088241.1 hypothetical protein ES319_A04G162500v1 [Gossypium barbadense]TYH23046.1 hypothetical protein ES288_A04G179200v1 [Gossypium darwinii]TYI34048.1 hypothetical protein ES332_A04G176800v1 [Gossypium tomentosum]TYJ40856.1 hypothetical protein E1A91_A04G170800v1 [Gossypium mustelinum]KAG4205953.1 hypothetical protein ERO13_A04G133900v2 [Gossypium hirsutum]
MTEVSRRRSLRLQLLFASVSLQFISGFSGDSTSSISLNSKSNANSKNGTKVVIILIVLVAVGLFSFFLFKVWQKRKRDEQYARLLKLFEEDGDLEAELGLHD